MIRMEIDPLTGLPKFVEETVVRGRGGGVPSGSGSANAGIPQYDTDPVSPEPEDAWVLKSLSGGTGGGAIVTSMGGGFFASKPNSGGSNTYQFSYRTLEGTTKRVTIS